MTETWLPIVGYEGHYEVSDGGSVRSVKTGRVRVMSQVLDSYGYYMVGLSIFDVCKKHKIHRLVCLAFNGPPPDVTFDCAHLDGSRINNVPDNLAWVSRAENMAHKHLHGTRQNCENGPGAKLTRVQVEEIRQKRAQNGWGCRVLSKQYGVSKSQITRILSGAQWNDQ